MSDALGVLWYDFLYAAVTAYATLGHTYRYAGRTNMPKTGPVLLIANHESYIDPVLVGVALPRRLAYLARANLFHGVLGRFLRSVNVHPVDQQGFAREGLKAVIDLLGAGWPVLVF